MATTIYLPKIKIMTILAVIDGANSYRASHESREIHWRRRNFQQTPLPLTIKTMALLPPSLFLNFMSIIRNLASDLSIYLLFV